MARWQVGIGGCTSTAIYNPWLPVSALLSGFRPLCFRADPRRCSSADKAPPAACYHLFWGSRPLCLRAHPNRSPAC